jgi:hypothetical protein
MVIFDPSDSNTASIVVADVEVGTALTMVLPAAGMVGVIFNITGMLTRVDDGTGLAGMTVQLQSYDGAEWSDVSGVVAVSDSDGSYVLELQEAKPGTYELRMHFAGATE